MKEITKIIACLVLLSGLTLTTNAQDHSQMQAQDQAGHKMVNPDKIQWGDAPAGLPAGAKAAVLSGDPTKEGPFTVRLVFPANYKISPHWHPTAENITVIKGTLYMGMGEQLNMNTATSLQSGAFALMPAKNTHYAFTKEETTVQVHGTGPFEINYINAADDPRKKEKLR